MTLNWLGSTATTRATCGATASWNSRVLPVTSTATSSLGRSFSTNFASSSSFHSFQYSPSVLQPQTRRKAVPVQIDSDVALGLHFLLLSRNVENQAE